MGYLGSACYLFSRNPRVPWTVRTVHFRKLYLKLHSLFAVSLYHFVEMGCPDQPSASSAAGRGEGKVR